MMEWYEWLILSYFLFNIGELLWLYNTKNGKELLDEVREECYMEDGYPESATEYALDETTYFLTILLIGFPYFAFSVYEDWKEND